MFSLLQGRFNMSTLSFSIGNRGALTSRLFFKILCDDVQLSTGFIFMGG